jgi:hypothetical protein
VHLLVGWEIYEALRWPPTGVLSVVVHCKDITAPIVLKLTIPLLIWSSRKTYGLLFDWLYPSRMPLLLRAITLWADEPEVVVCYQYVLYNHFTPLCTYCMFLLRICLILLCITLYFCKYLYILAHLLHVFAQICYLSLTSLPIIWCF